jgi:hypothetical protein
MTFAEQVALALRRAETTESAAPRDGPRGPGTHRRTPDPVAYALGWVVANAVVTACYRSAGIDVLPAYDFDRGWSRFLITRRVSCWLCTDDPVGDEASIVLDGPGAPVFVCPRAGRPVALREALSADPGAAVQGLLLRLAPPQLPAGEHADCWHERAGFYPRLYGAVTELVLQYPNVAAFREIFVDDQEIDGAFHPLYLHGIVTSPRAVYDWCGVETGEYAAYVRIDGRSALYATDAGGWSTVGKAPNEEDGEGMKRRLEGWLRLAGRPDPEGVD